MLAEQRHAGKGHLPSMTGPLFPLTVKACGSEPWSMTTQGWMLDDLRVEEVNPITGSARDFSGLLEMIGDRRFVLIGEASHGTHEFYRERARITARLIEELGFNAVAVEADWPDAYRVNRYVCGQAGDDSAVSALEDFRRFPAWMWRNADVVNFLEWMRARNDAQSLPASKVGFYGLDLYSMRTSMETVVNYLDHVDLEAARLARERYGCFDLFQGEGQHYGHSVHFDLAASCEEEVIAELIDLRERKASILAQDGWVAEDEYFFAEQNARLVLNAEHYYRQMYHGRVSSWNLRDQHMAQTLQALADHLDLHRDRSKIVVWAHNSHVGDARMTDMGRRGEFNIGQLTRQAASKDCFIIGLTTHHGRVTAASEWGGIAERKRVRPALEHSYEAYFHTFGRPAFWLPMESNAEAIPSNQLERAIGVIYRPETEFTSHWFRADLVGQFDAVIHIDETSALTPLERTSTWDMGEPPETFPSGL